MARASADLADLLTEDFRDTPYWWDQAPALPDFPGEAPTNCDVAVIGAGYTGLNAALVTARGGRGTQILEAADIGTGCSSRNGGQISTSIKPDLAALSRRWGAERARAIHEEGKTALEWIGELIEREGIDCGFRRAGRFHAANTPRDYERLAKQTKTLDRDLGIESRLVSRAEQHRELGSDAYFGGLLFPRHAALQPAQYQRGLLERVLEAGARVLPHCPVLTVERDGSGFRLTTPRGSFRAGEVVVATNGYTGPLTPWLRRRVIPIGSYMIATEPLMPGLVEELFPTDRIASDTCRVVYYYRASPDRRRIVFGGRVSAGETDPLVSAPRLHAELVRIFPELAGTRVSHSWTGTVAYSFDELAHTGVHEGLHYAMSYCGSGVSMASYLGMKVGEKVLGRDEGRTAFDGLPFPTRPLYHGTPWFLPAVVAWYRWRDRFDRQLAT